MAHILETTQQDRFVSLGSQLHANKHVKTYRLLNRKEVLLHSRDHTLVSCHQLFAAPNQKSSFLSLLETICSRKRVRTHHLRVKSLASDQAHHHVLPALCISLALCRNLHTSLGLETKLYCFLLQIFLLSYLPHLYRNTNLLGLQGSIPD